MERPSRDGAFVRPEAEAFTASPSISVDYAIMEKTDQAVVCPVDIEWSDVGSWESLWNSSIKDDAGNAVSGEVVTLESRNSVLRSESGALIAAIGLESMAVIVTRDAVLVAPLDRAEEVKVLVQTLQTAGHDSVSAPAQVFRPWGSYERMDAGERFQTKRIVVKPGGSLSLQKHQHRSEHWIVVKGTAEVTVGEKTVLLQENESTFIPAGALHRLANPTEEPLHIIEVQCGQYLGEDDIVRVEDRYGRMGSTS
jgi:mannose-1-phosphate guanylyltransferase/mannose-6-phosphate isomerase